MASDYWKCTLCVGYNNNKVLDLSENVSGLIDYVLYPFDEDYLVWCETNTQTQETKYPRIKISSES